MIQDIPPVTWVDNGEDMMRFVRHVEDTAECAVDTETTGLNRWQDHVLFWSAAPDEGSRYCFSRRMLEIYDKELSQNPYIDWYFTNATFDLNMMRNSGVRVPVGDVYCTLAMDWLNDENRQGRHGLKETAWDHLEFGMREFKEAFMGKKKGESIQDRLLRAMEEDFQGAISYASTDAWASLRVFKWLQNSLANQYNSNGVDLWTYFQDVEMPFTRVLYNCCERGIMIDVGYLDELAPKIQDSITEIEKGINKIAGKVVNPRSPMQLGWLFFEKLGIKPIKWTSGGQSGNRKPSTDAGCLSRWADEGVEAAQLIKQHRDLSKTLGTYVTGLRKWVDPEYRIHPTLTQHVTVTGRLSSVDPNLQNIPRPGTDRFGLRTAFMPKEDHVLLVIDYEQLEMRLMAHHSGDPAMIDVINKGWDIHAGTASLMYGFDYDDIIAAGKRKKLAAKDPNVSMTKQEKEMTEARQAAKAIGFGLNYGEGPAKLGAGLGVSKEEAKRLMAKYFEPYPKVEDFIDSVHERVKSECVVETILGRPRRFPDMESLGGLRYWDMKGHEKKLFAQMLRQDVNSIIQGGAADVAKMAMILCDTDPQLNDLGADLLLQVHDELLFEVPEENIDQVEKRAIELMMHPFDRDLSVPLDVDSGWGYSWSSAKA